MRNLGSRHLPEAQSIATERSGSPSLTSNYKPLEATENTTVLSHQLACLFVNETIFSRSRLFICARGKQGLARLAPPLPRDRGSALVPGPSDTTLIHQALLAPRPGPPISQNPTPGFPAPPPPVPLTPLVPPSSPPPVCSPAGPPPFPPPREPGPPWPVSPAQCAQGWQARPAPVAPSTLARALPSVRPRPPGGSRTSGGLGAPTSAPPEGSTRVREYHALQRWRRCGRGTPETFQLPDVRPRPPADAAKCNPPQNRPFLPWYLPARRTAERQR